MSFASSFTDADSAITGYDWDFDGNGTVDRSTDTPTTSFAYGAAGTFAARVLAKDFRGGAGTATATVRVVAASTPPAPPPPPPAAPPPAKPVISYVTSPPRGRLVVRVTCAARCALTGTLKISTADRRKLGLPRRTVRTVKRTITSKSRQTITLKLSPSVINAMKRRGLTRLSISASFTAKYADGRSTKSSKSIRVRR